MGELRLWAFAVPIFSVSAAFAFAACLGARRTDQPALERRHVALGALVLLFAIITVPGVLLTAFALPITIAETPLLPLALVATGMLRQGVKLLSGEAAAAERLDENARMVVGLGFGAIVMARIEGAAFVDSPAAVFGAWALVAAAGVTVLARPVTSSHPCNQERYRPLSRSRS